MNGYPLPWYVKRLAWPIGVALLVVLVACLVWLLKRPAVPQLPNVADTREDLIELLAIQQERNAGIRMAITHKQKEIEQFSCPLETPDVNDSLHLEGRSTSPNSPTQLTPDSTAPVNPGPGESESQFQNLPQVTGSEQPLKPSELRRQVTAAVVYIGAYKGREGGSGTGFFIAENIVMTNAHVVAGNPDKITVYSEALKRVSSAEIVGFAYGKTPGSRDYALLKIADFNAPSIMSLTDNPASFMKVFTAGYPGVYGEILEALDPDRTPDLVITDGIISAIKVTPHNVPAISHTASVYKGNSGGPLVNQCGSVVGINTFYVTPGRESAKIDFALGSSDIKTFAEAKGFQVKMRSELCE